MNLLLAEKLAKHLMKEWEVGEDWKFVWTNSKRQLGSISQTKMEHVLTGTPLRCQLRLSRHLVRNNGETEVRDTILHEIAHIKAGHKAGHGPRWKQWARTVGAKPVRCADGSEVNMVEPNYLVVCTVCGNTTRKVHRRIRLEKRYHRQCGQKSLGKLELQWNPKRGQTTNQ